MGNQVELALTFLIIIVVIIIISGGSHLDWTGEQVAASQAGKLDSLPGSHSSETLQVWVW